MMGDIFSYLYQFADVFAFLILSAAGLAIVFGMMGIINMAHGEFIMCGGPMSPSASFTPAFRSSRHSFAAQSLRG
jgi:branched-subunit amino acid ABC-type transport system permease component